jgi:large subunit ribosomal protein L4
MKEVGEVELSDSVFAAKVDKPLLQESVRMILANMRVGTASTKTRAEVKATGKKPYRQKGTGRARHGSYASPIFVGGGITFGPKPRDYSFNMPKKKKRLALASALSSKVAEGKLLVLDKWEEKKKTKEMAKVFDNMKVGSALIVLDGPNGLLQRVVRNIPNISVINLSALNTYNILAHEHLIFTKDVAARLNERFAK